MQLKWGLTQEMSTNLHVTKTRGLFSGTCIYYQSPLFGAKTF